MTLQQLFALFPTNPPERVTPLKTLGGLKVSVDTMLAPAYAGGTDKGEAMFPTIEDEYGFGIIFEPTHTDEDEAFYCDWILSGRLLFEEVEWNEFMPDNFDQWRRENDI